jgi:hypothetical protein
MLNLCRAIFIGNWAQVFFVANGVATIHHHTGTARHHCRP